MLKRRVKPTIAPPPQLDKYAKEAWATMIQKLGTKINLGALAAYCESYSRWRRAGEELNKVSVENPLSGLIIRTKGGAVVEQPLVTVSNKAISDMIRYADMLKEKSLKNDGKESKQTKEDAEQEKVEQELVLLYQRSQGRIGRPSKLDEQITRDLEMLSRLGLSDRSLADAVAIPVGTLERWKKKHKAFRERLKRAKTSGKSLLINSILGHGRRNWQAHAWLLERQYQDEFAISRKVELSNDQKSPLRFRIIFDKPKENESEKVEL